MGTRHWPEDADEYVEELEQQLAKANERVAELEFQHQLLTKRIEPLLDMQEDGEYYARCHLADDIYEAFIEGSSVGALNKFAIEKKIELLSEMVSSASVYLFKHDKLDIRANHLDMLLKNFCNYHREQLRKGQE